MLCGIGSCGQVSVGYTNMTEKLIVPLCDEHTGQLFRAAMKSSLVPPWKTLPKRGPNEIPRLPSTT